ncbi:multifunctional 2',3'-cyclic-nucleotide 2'-phosphodiesterase/5'-nucleotidase/3'-nucleotidase [Phycicoccus sp. Root563]|uniref:bifunctional metallophosphatase/5'-nucleotidase n=1 Tax=Phycicoccus sp. Root563 TaxID=1736562 RepID=UPI00070361F4|nr:bifunctional metallophosphatase/5'-nucleotidase [Phycicoccus sp. Root563]KQZ90115.1 multifunctional 2',3'-cyclic-nucleotide 2'-phosphodiesterase/5'-nucleotidase/3'-nucleotidase [Phycicoccus sp. Root563]
MTSPHMRRLGSVVAVAAMATTGLALTSGTSSAHRPGSTMDIQLLSFNDFHGNLEAPSGSSGRVVTGHALSADGKSAVDVNTDAGGVEYLATHLKQARQGHKNSLTVAAGDIVGASPLLSAAFHDEPTIESMNSLGLDVTSVGNHEFDEGYKELQRLAKGGCLDDGAGKNNQDSCPGGKKFKGADFDILAANVVYAKQAAAASAKHDDDKGHHQKGPKAGDTILPAYSIQNVHGAKIGFIGMTLKDTPNIVTKSGVEGLEFKDEVQTANSLVPELRRKGVNAIVVLIHQGGNPAKESWVGPDGKTYSVNPTYDYTCDKGGQLDIPSSPILGIAANLDPAIDMVVSGHTHQPYVCNIPDPKGQPRLVTSASSFGRLFTETDLKYDTRTRDIVRASVKGSNMVVTRDVPKDAAQTRLIAQYKTLVAPIASRVLGSASTDVVRTTNAGGESPLGDLIADAQLADPSVVTGGKTPTIAFMNPGGIRADLGAGEVTYEEAFTVQPFNNYLVSMDLTGAQIKALLTQQWTGANAGAPKVLQVSKGFAYTYSGTTLGSVTLNGAPLVDGQTYRIVTNNFLSDGGDGFPAFVGGTDKYFGGLDIDAFANYLEANSPYTPGALTRITKN